LRSESNKKERFDFLYKKVTSFDYPDGKEVYITFGTKVLSNGVYYEMEACDHEEADTRLLVHVIDAAEKGHSNCLICTVDTDVIVILVGYSFICIL